MKRGKTIDEIHVGDTAAFSKTITETDVYMYAGITGDFNPAHIDDVYAAGTFFKKRIAHGMLTAGFISGLLGTRLPGPGTIYIKQDLQFMAPVYFGDTITATVTVKAVLTEKNRVIVTTTCTNQDEKVVLDGEAMVMPPKAG
ncbi:MAG: enoyl-CoA hydratase [Deltaproteobacteria bacterium]|nr:MAG: enoyl-CoA hydratase [Deltaproteobacteria bacterium]